MLSDSRSATVAETNCYDYLSSFSDADKPWDTHRRNAEAVVALYRQGGFDRYADRMQECSGWLLFALRTAEDSVLRLKLHSAHFCRVRHCPVCQWRKSMMWRGRFLKAMPKLLEDYPTTRFIFLTLTVRNCPVGSLRSQLAEMNLAWKRLSQRRDFSQVQGWVKSVEVTRAANRDSRGRFVSWQNDAHPHFHCLLAVPPNYFSRNYIKQEKWRELWQSCLRVDYLPVVHVQAVKPRASKPTESSNQPSPLIIALCETLKYTVKEEELTSDSYWLEQLTNQLHKTRSVAVGGILKEYLSEEEPEDLIHGDDDDEVDVSLDDCSNLVFDWATIIKRYVLRK